MKKTSAAPVVASVKEMLRRHRDEWEPDRCETLQREIAYFETNAKRTRYGHFQAQGYFIGSGVVEAGCKTVVGRRMKQSGMFWGQRGAESLLTLRCLLLGPHFNAAWEARKPILAAQREKSRRWSPADN